MKDGALKARNTPSLFRTPCTLTYPSPVPGILRKRRYRPTDLLSNSNGEFMDSPARDLLEWVLMNRYPALILVHASSILRTISWPGNIDTSLFAVASSDGKIAALPVYSSLISSRAALFGVA